MKSVQVADEHVPVLQRVLGGADAPDLREVGEYGKINYLVQEDITQATVAIWDRMIAARQSRMGPRCAAGLQQVRDAIWPYVGNQLLRAGMWLSGRRYEMYIDPVAQSVVHFTSSAMADPEGTSSEQRSQLLAGGGSGVFTWDELQRQQQALGQLDLLPVEAVSVTCWRTESRAVIHRANKFPYYSLSHFWINSHRVLEARFLGDVDRALCQPISEEEFLRLLAQCLHSPIFDAKLCSLGQFALGQWMENEWNRQSAVAEVGGEYYAAYWSTSG